MDQSRQRLAWLILWVSFFSFVALLGGAVFGLATYLRGSTRPLAIVAQANQGTIVVLQNGSGSRAIRVGDLPQPVAVNEQLQTSGPDTGLMLIYSPDGSELLGRVQLYGNSNLSIERASSPRFRFNPEGQRVWLRLSSGRLQLTLLPTSSPGLLVNVTTPQVNSAMAAAGQYSFAVNNADSQVAVQEGQASLVAAGQSLTINANQRAIVPTGDPPLGPLDPERNLVRNGDFDQGFAEWVQLAGSVELADQPPAEVGITVVIGEPAVRFARQGVGHADVSIRQVIDQDVTDYQSLRLQITMRLEEQSIGVCGVQGSECPLTVAIEYEDDSAASRTWQQGFYASGQINADTTPDVCRFCAPPLNEHLRLPLNQLVFYESENLLEQLARQGISPRRIKNVWLIAAGHAFAVDVVEVGLIAVE
jgi:hypothetical protein